VSVRRVGCAVSGALALCIATAAGCGEKRDRGAAGPPRDPTPTSPIPDRTRQLVVGVTDGWDESAAELRVFERGPRGRWRQVGEPWPGRVGRTGLAWGRGLHGGAPAVGGEPVKAEGDGRAPAGLFAIGRTFGYAERPDDGSKMPYTRLTESWRCVDDPASASYNRVLDATGHDPDWKSAETMLRSDDLYRWVLEIDHNSGASTAASGAARPLPGAGSCIFFHVWADASSPTAGCTAMARGQIEGLLRFLTPSAYPAYTLLPRDAYRRLTRAWNLPTF